MKSELISIISQAFYGNRTGTEIRRENIDRFILGDLTDDFDVTEPVDRTIIHLPGSDNLVLIYNKYQEVERLEAVPTVQVFPEGVGAIIRQPILDEYMRHMEVETFGVEYGKPVVKRWSTEK